MSAALLVSVGLTLAVKPRRDDAPGYVAPAHGK
jgi:hypothetical protein